VGGATFPTPAGVKTSLITGPMANADYTVRVQLNITGNTVMVTPSGATMADAAGVLSVTF
jgi:hypothetical protein